MSFSIKKVGIAVSTFTEEATDPTRYEIIKRSLDSLLRTVEVHGSGLEVVIFVVIDGPVPEQHLRLIEQYQDKFIIVQREDNGGIAKAKNTSIRAILECEADLGVLVDDDVLFTDDWLSVYVGMIKHFELHHLTWNDARGFERLKTTKPHSNSLKTFAYVEKQGYKLIRHNGAAGIFLTFTPALIEKIGFFKVMPGKIGGEHIQFTRRANRAGFIGQPIDLADSYKYVSHLGNADEIEGSSSSVIVRSVSEEFRMNEQQNSGLSMQDLDQYCPCVE